MMDLVSKRLVYDRLVNQLLSATHPNTHNSLLENKICGLRSEIIEQYYYATVRRAQLSDSGQAIMRYQNAIEYKQQQQ